MSPLPALPCSLIIDDASKVGEARRLANCLADRLDFEETARGNLAIVVTEAATNLLKFAPGGELIFRCLVGDHPAGLEMLSIDRGPGILDPEKCMSDGYSTAGTLGAGLGAMSRLSSEFHLHTMPGAGTVSIALLPGDGPPANNRRPTSSVQVGAVSVPMPGELLNGDAWAIRSEPGPVTSLVVVDGLGHGPQAAQAAHEAIRVFEEKSSALGPEELLRSSHEALRRTRGAAMAVCRIDHRKAEVRFAGIGNISALIVNPQTARNNNLVSYNGTVGHVIRKIQEFSHPWPREAILIMHSDGLSARWDLGKYPGLTARHAGLIAGVIYRDSRRGRDDATVVIIREPEGGEG